MDKMKRTLLIHYRDMGVGGIESYIIRVVAAALAEGNRVIWLCEEKPIIAPIYEAVMNDARIERCVCNIHKHYWFKHQPLHFEADEKVVILSFSAFDHARSLEIKKKYRNNQITALYLVPHFTGGLIYPEQFFRLWKGPVRRLFAKLYQQWIDSGSVLYFNDKHTEALEKAYALTVPERYRRKIPSADPDFLFDEAAVLRRYSREEFRIVSAGRLDFPHKGFVLGMIGEYANLKQRYPNITYYVIGEGPGEKTLQEEIEKLPKYAASDIHVLKPMSFDALLEFYRNCNLNISAAGCASYGAKVGLPTLPVRHYTQTCEVYGFLPASRDCLLETKPGVPVGPYVEKVLHMTQQEYLSLSLSTYESYEKRTYNPNAFFEIDCIDEYYTMKESDHILVKLCFAGRKIVYIIAQIKKKLGFSA